MHAAAAVAEVAAQQAAGAERQRVASARPSVFVLLLRSGGSSSSSSSSANLNSASVADIQTQRIADLESALHAERTSNLHTMREHLHLKTATERETFARALRSAPSTPRVVETPRDVARDAERADVLQQLHQARAEALHFKSEYNKFVVSYETLGLNLTRASERVERAMQVYWFSNETPNP